MRLNKTTAGMIASALIIQITGCAQSDKDLLAEAQYCLDKATQATAASCMSKISSLTSPQSYALRCAQGFITAGVTSAENLSDAVTAIKAGSGATGMLAALSFPTLADAKTTFSACSSSGQSGLALIGAMAKSATLIASIGGDAIAICSDPTKTAECKTALTTNMTTLINNPNSESAAEIADAVGTVYDTTCSGASASSSEICNQINTAADAAGVDPATMTSEQKKQFASQLLTNWKK